MDKTKHVMLIGPGAEEFASKTGLEIVPLTYFNAGKQAKKKDDKMAEPVEGGGTVGCVCLDQKGNLAAATSTGGIGVVMPGRVGDTPICGAGTYVSLTPLRSHFSRMVAEMSSGCGMLITPGIR